MRLRRFALIVSPSPSPFERLSPRLVNDGLLVFSVTQFKIDQNKNENRSIDKVQNLGNERR